MPGIPEYSETTESPNDKQILSHNLAGDIYRMIYGYLLLN